MAAQDVTLNLKQANLLGRMKFEVRETTRVVGQVRAPFSPT